MSTTADGGVSATLAATASAAASSAAASTASPASYKVIGVLLAVGSGLFIGSSFVIKKKGLLASQKKSTKAAGEGHEYLKSWVWWLGMTLMVLGEVLNFVAYAFAEKLTFFGKIGCLLAILGSTIVALNGPQEQSTTTIAEFKRLFLAPGFLAWGSIVIAASLFLAFWAVPRYGKTHMLVHISICSLIGGLSVACTSGLGASILTSIRGDNQVKNWFFWFLVGFVVITLLTEINFLNKALELFNTAMVTPTYFVLFTGCTLVTTAILNQGFKTSPENIGTVVLGFLVICCGITLLQLSKIDPNDVKGGGPLDRRTTLLLSASRARMAKDTDNDDEEKALAQEDPGIDALRGTFGAFGSIHRARSASKSMRSRRESGFRPIGRKGAPGAMGSGPSEVGMDVLRNGVQLYDNPMPYDAEEKISQYSGSLKSPAGNGPDFTRPRSSSIAFAPSDAIHRYPNDPRGQSSHTQLDRAPGTHEHMSIVPGSSDITNHGFSPSAAFRSGGFSPVPGTGAFQESDSRHPAQYEDPFEDSTDPADRPQVLQHSRSAPEVAPHVAAKPQTEGDRFRIAAPFTRDRSSSRTREGHGVQRPKGPADLEQDESRGLVSKHAATDSTNTDDADIDAEEDQSSLSRWDSRDVL
ncbi:hypothetical protein OIO90_001729 [Microbotryomycetes sp. JL221]|nr:hypothetical protein OIO90_001729 [Microbotryomycetes sp. JL221]